MDNAKNDAYYVSRIFDDLNPHTGIFLTGIELSLYTPNVTNMMNGALRP